MAFSWLTAVGLIVMMAVSAFFHTVSNEMCLTSVNSFVKYFVDLMKFQFFELWVVDTVYRIVEYICTQFLVVGVQAFFCVVCPGVYARLPPRANAGVEPNTAFTTHLLQDAVDTEAPVLIDPAPDATAALADAVEPVGQPTNSFARWQYPAIPAVQPNDTRTPFERLAALKEKRRGH